MGNRAVIAFENMNTIGIYLHWEGGPGSVLGFIDGAKAVGARSPGNDDTYAFAALVSVITDVIHDKAEKDMISVGVGPIARLDTDNWDNGVYWIGDDWRITRREFTNDTPANTVDELPSDYDKKAYRRIYDAVTQS